MIDALIHPAAHAEPHAVPRPNPGLTQRADAQVNRPAVSAVTSGSPTTCARTLARMLDSVNYGLLLVTDQGRVTFANLAARGELDENHPLVLHGSELHARRDADSQALREAIFDASHRGLQKMLNLGDASLEALSVSVVPMSHQGHDGADSQGAMLSFGKRLVCEDLSADAFARFNRLTSAETRVLKQLCAGRRPIAIARDQGVALSTVRTQIGCIRAKTGAADIGGIVRLVAKLPPLVNAMRAA